ncbi:hypothetical protein Bpfe_016202 [Biomphalaria pfeifferi]|uniref:Uncharacterized protein n=1 Tax=Biomphalaria pfeifferi TaxID=112525 RepID=A0AAD8BGY6_BIOPF|nr:hypothetical protein Bpfe_016202 [Biomphalaria pfeifferi]
MLGFFEEQPYPWIELAKGVVIILVVLYLFYTCKENEDVVTYAFRVAVDATGSALNFVFGSFENLVHMALSNYRIPLVIAILTWWMFPEIIDDFLFLVYLGYQRYKNLLFS